MDILYLMLDTNEQSLNHSTNLSEVAEYQKYWERWNAISSTIFMEKIIQHWESM